jgi:ABC-type bacteriocin/lantibiotic exporter with double-glycine peptidase domain
MRFRLSCVLGHSSKDCGPAALATVAQHYGLRIGLLRLHEILNTDLQGTDLQSLREGAEQLEFDASCGKLKPHALDLIPLPAIVHFSTEACGHFVVLHKVSPRVVVIADPARGIVKLPRAEFLQSWSSQILLLRPRSDFRDRYRQRSPLVDLVRTAMTERRLLLASAVLAVLVAISAYATSFFIRTIIDRVVPAKNLSLLQIFGIGMCVIVATRTLFGLLRQYWLARVGMNLSLSLGIEYVRYLVFLPLTFYDRIQTGDLLARFLDAPKVAGAIALPLLSVILDVLLLVACSLFMFEYNISLTLITLCFFPIVLVLTIASIPALKRKERAIYERFSRLSGRFVETVNNIRIVKAYAYEKDAHERIARVYAEVQQAQIDRTLLSNSVGAASSFLTGAASICLLWVGTRFAIDKRLSVGELMFFYSVLGLFLGSIDRLAPSVASIQEAVTGLERLKEVCTIPQENTGCLFKFGVDDSCESIEFRNVSFWYRPNYPALSDVNLSISRGETLAILGETGSGKSTLASLINCLYEAKAGDVFINGRNVRDMDKISLRRRIAMVLQEPGLMSGSIRDNIAFGAPEATIADIREAAVRAMAHEFISALPRGYDYELGSFGNGLSCGQRQRIAIARALLRNPAVLILDEATSNLDPETERVILDRLRLHDRLRVTIVVTHRINMAARAHRIIILENGEIVESGTHEDLLQSGGKYHHMWRAFAPMSSSKVTGTGADCEPKLSYGEKPQHELHSS